jgi:membrane-associated phospholipid phosphatase
MTVAHHVKTDAAVTWGVALKNWPLTIVASIKTLLRAPRIHPRERWLWPTGKLVLATAAVVAVFALTQYFFDAAAIVYARTLPRPLTDFFDWITDFGKSGWFLWPLGILFLVLAALQGRLSQASQVVMAAIMVRVGFLFVAIGIPGLFTTVAKQFIGRARPFVGGVADPYLFKPFTWAVAAWASLPSGHATTVGSVLVAFGTLWPKSRPYLMIYALLILVSRVVVTAHHPSDVLAGLLVGAVGTLMVQHYFALRRLGFAVGPAGQLHVYPGPSLKRIKSVARELLA